MTRLASGLLATALVRRTNAAGDFATVLAKGDAESGMILVVATQRGGAPQCWERGWDDAGRPALVATGPADPGGDPAELTAYWQRRHARDPDLWVIELDSAQAERFAAETILAD